MRPATYFVTALFAVSTALGAVTPIENEGNEVRGNEVGDEVGEMDEEPDAVTLTEADLTPIPDDDLEERGLFGDALSCSVKVCKKKNYKNCYSVSGPAGRCFNLKSSDGRPFVSSKGGGCLCTAYSKKGCPWIAGDKKGFKYAAKFGFHANSIQCSVY